MKKKELWKKVLVWAYQNGTLSLCMPCFSIISTKHNLPHSSPWSCWQALGNHFVFISSRILKLVQQHSNEVRKTFTLSHKCDHMYLYAYKCLQCIIRANVGIFTIEQNKVDYWESFCVQRTNIGTPDIKDMTS